MLKLNRTAVCVSRNVGSINRYYSGKNTQPGSRQENEKQSPEEVQRSKEEAAKLAMQSFKDLGGMFSGSSGDKETETIDSKPIFEDPSKFKDLSLLHQGQILQELQAKYDKKWTRLTPQEKLLGYYIYYGNWGPREKFSNWSSLETPFDLPFVEPVKRVNPKPNDKIKELPPLYLLETPIRKDQFDTKKMDNVTKFFIYVTLFVSLLALIRDKKIGEEGKPQEVIIRDLYEEERQKRLQQEEEEKIAAEKLQKEKQNRKWYYLWLK